jgi:C-terminal processing protease CtpA/Prc
MLKQSFMIFLTFASIVLNAQNTTDSSFDINKKFSITQLKYDLTVLKDSLEILHPALYRYTPKHSLDSIFRVAYKRINKPMLLSEFYGIVAPLISKVGDIHTAIELPADYQNYLATKGNLFPFDVRIINEEVFIVSNNSSDSTIRVGSRISKINNELITKVLSKMESYFSSEGANETFKLRRVEQRFAFHYQFVYGYFKQFEIECIEQEGKKPNTKTVSALPFSVIRANRAKNQLLYPHLKPLFPLPPYLTISLNEENQTAILSIKWFQNDVLQSNGEQFKPFIDSAFMEINKANIKNLVIDIRNNGGGESENASYLYAYLTDKPFRFLYGMETSQKTYENEKKDVRYTFIKDTGKYRSADSSVKSSQFFGLNIQRPKPNNFAGNLYVLIDGLTTSAAPQFASLIKLNKRGRLIGEEVPGALHGGCGRSYSYFLLPNTELLTMISHYRLYMTSPGSKTKDICVAPDYKTTVTISDLLKGVDKDMEFALKLINKNN